MYIFGFGFRLVFSCVDSKKHQNIFGNYLKLIEIHENKTVLDFKLCRWHVSLNNAGLTESSKIE